MCSTCLRNGVKIVGRPGGVGLRTCEKCGLTDDLAHHIQVLVGDVSTSKHFWCCAEDGCPICLAGGW